ncbi:hypothetical protein Vretifemale_15850, partial [Volvox reticuliferus]
HGARAVTDGFSSREWELQSCRTLLYDPGITVPYGPALCRGAAAGAANSGGGAVGVVLWCVDPADCEQISRDGDTGGDGAGGSGGADDSARPETDGGGIDLRCSLAHAGAAAAAAGPPATTAVGA